MMPLEVLTAADLATLDRAWARAKWHRDLARATRPKSKEAAQNYTDEADRLTRLANAGDVAALVSLET